MPASCAFFFSSLSCFESFPSSRCWRSRYEIVIVSPVTPRDVAPPLLPLKSTQPGEYGLPATCSAPPAQSVAGATPCARGAETPGATEDVVAPLLAPLPVTVAVPGTFTVPTVPGIPVPAVPESTAYW